MLISGNNCSPPLDCSVRTDLTAAQAGLAAEMLVCFDLARRGITPVPNPVAGAYYDVLADMDGGRMLKIQVKSTAKFTLKDKGPRKAQPTYRFVFSKDGKGKYAGIDLFAFVALDIPAVLYLSPEAFRKEGKYAHKSFSAARFVQDAPTSFERFWITQ